MQPSSLFPDILLRVQPSSLFPDILLNVQPSSLFPDILLSVQPSSLFPDILLSVQPSSLFPDIFLSVQPSSLFPEILLSVQPSSLFPDILLSVQPSSLFPDILLSVQPSSLFPEILLSVQPSSLFPDILLCSNVHTTFLFHLPCQCSTFNGSPYIILFSQVQSGSYFSSLLHTPTLSSLSHSVSRSPGTEYNNQTNIKSSIALRGHSSVKKECRCGGRVKLSGKKRYEGVGFNVISVMGVGGGLISRKKALCNT